MTDHESLDNAIVALAASPEGICFAASQQGLGISRDGGATWQPAMPEAEGIAVTALALSPVAGVASADAATVHHKHHMVHHHKAHHVAHHKKGVHHKKPVHHKKVHHTHKKY